MKRNATILASILCAALLTGCGGGNQGSARAVINGQEYEMSVQSSMCLAALPTGPSVPGYDGVMDTTLDCTMSFDSRTNISEYLVIRVSSVTAIYRDYLGTWIPMTQGLVWADLSFQGLPETMYSGSILFDSISNYVGDTVCATYEILTGNGSLEGSFCTEVREGY